MTIGPQKGSGTCLISSVWSRLRKGRIGTCRTGRRACTDWATDATNAANAADVDVYAEVGVGVGIHERGWINSRIDGGRGLMAVRAGSRRGWK